MWYYRKKISSHLKPNGLIHLFNVCETYLNRCFTTEHVNIYSNNLLMFINTFDYSNGLFPYTTCNYNCIAFCKINNDLVTLDSQWSHFIF